MEIIRAEYEKHTEMDTGRVNVFHFLFFDGEAEDIVAIGDDSDLISKGAN